MRFCLFVMSARKSLLIKKPGIWKLSLAGGDGGCPRKERQFSHGVRALTKGRTRPGGRGGDACSDCVSVSVSVGVCVGVCVCRWLAGHTLPSGAVRSHPGFPWVPGLISSLPSATRVGMDPWYPEEGRVSHGGHVGAQKEDSSHGRGDPGKGLLPGVSASWGQSHPPTFTRDETGALP